MSSTFRFVFTADWHIARSAWRRSGIEGDADAALDQVVTFCELSGVRHLLAGGDLLDSADPSPEDIDVVHRQLDRLKAAGCDVWYVQGQHERHPKKPWLATHPHPKHAHKNDFTIGPYRLRGLDWTPASRLADLLAEVPTDADFLLCHQVWSDFMGDHIETEGALAQVPARGVLTGDCHRCAIKPFKNAGGRPANAYSPGSMAMQSIDEPERKFFFAFRDDFTSASIALVTRPVFRHRVESAGELDALLADGLEIDLGRADAVANLPPALRTPLLQVTYPDDLAGAHARLVAATAGRFHLFPKPYARPRAEEEAAVLARRAVIEGGLLGALPLLAPEGRVRQGALRLLAAANPVDELEAMYRECCSG